MLLSNYNLPKINKDNFYEIDPIIFVRVSSTKWLGLLNALKQMV